MYVSLDRFLEKNIVFLSDKQFFLLFDIGVIQVLYRAIENTLRFGTVTVIRDF